MSLCLCTAQISAFWNAQMQAYLQPGSAGWIMWSLKMEGGGIWSLETCYKNVRCGEGPCRMCTVPEHCTACITSNTHGLLSGSRPRGVVMPSLPVCTHGMLALSLRIAAHHHVYCALGLGTGLPGVHAAAASAARPSVAAAVCAASLGVSGQGKPLEPTCRPDRSSDHEGSKTTVWPPWPQALAAS